MDSKMGVDKLEEPNPTTSYALSGKIMLTAIVVMLAVVVFLISIHFYARWYLHRMQLRHLRRTRHRRRRRTHLVLYVEPNITTPSATARGLDADVLNSLPVFVYPSAGTHPDSLQCAVCLSEFEENEKGRLLPKCNHSFHTDCIDMWFHSHSTCPICRSPVEPVTENTSLDVAIEPDSSTEQVHEEHVSVTSSTTSLGDPRKAFDVGMSVTIEVSRRIESDELELSSSASQGFKSPPTRLQSLKRMLSFNRKHGTSSGSTTELDTESVRDELTQQQTPVETPWVIELKHSSDSILPVSGSVLCGGG